MIGLKSNLKFTDEISSKILPLTFHPTFYHVFEKVQKWLTRFPQFIDSSFMNDLVILYLVATKKFLDHRNCSHLFRLILSIYSMQKKLLHLATFFPRQRYLEVRWIPAELLYPFSSKQVLGCLIIFNELDKYEVLDEENTLLILQKYLPELKLVRESSYCHPSHNKNYKLFYFEIEKNQGATFSLEEQRVFKNNLKEKIKHCIQKLSPANFNRRNEEENLKNIPVLNQEIQAFQNPPEK